MTRRLIVKAAFLGAVLSLLGIFPVVAAWAAIWQIDVPFRGWVGGLEGVRLSPGVALLWGVAAGGFPTLAICGAIGGAMTQRALNAPKMRCIAILMMSLVIDIVVFSFAVLF